MPDTDSPYELAFAAARDAAPAVDPADLRAAIDRYMQRLHAAITRRDAEHAMTPAEILEAFRPAEG